MRLSELTTISIKNASSLRIKATTKVVIEKRESEANVTRSLQFPNAKVTKVIGSKTVRSDGRLTIDKLL